MVMTVDELETALSIPVPDDARLVVDDCRRLTGPGLLWKTYGAILDVFVTEDVDKNAVAQAWAEEARRTLDDVGWHAEKTISRKFENGLNLAISAPIDQLYSAIFVAQIAWYFTAHRILGTVPDNREKLIADVRAVMREEANPELLALLNEADRRAIDFLSDDDHVSLGHGIGSETWPVRELPAIEDIPWDRLHNLPVALITGTNGKSTSVRLSAAIGEAEGIVSGTTSTDYVKIGDDILDYGDYSGPGGARMLLRDKRLQLAFLEVARGGILRRGLPLRQAQAALVTNIAADHLGQYGVNTVEALADAKFAVARTLAADGTLVLNADDPLVVNNGRKAERQVCWFSLNADNPEIALARASGGLCCWLKDGMIYYSDGATTTPVLAAADAPITMNGLALFNVRNVMGALCLGKALGLSDTAIHKGLTTFESKPEDNPGRCNEFQAKGARVFVDFAHNPHSVEAVSEALAHVPSKRKFLLLGHAGDRSDQDITDLTNSALAFEPDAVVIVELEEYLRGRELGEVSNIIEKACLDNGLKANVLRRADSPPAGTKLILDDLQQDDLALLLVLDERDTVFELLNQAG